MKGRKYNVVIFSDFDDKSARKIEQVHGYPFSYKGIKLFVHKLPQAEVGAIKSSPNPDGSFKLDKWRVSEYYTGLFILDGYATRKKAIDAARAKVDKVSAEHVKGVIRRHVKDCGQANGKRITN